MSRDAHSPVLSDFICVIVFTYRNGSRMCECKAKATHRCRRTPRTRGRKGSAFLVPQSIQQKRAAKEIYKNPCSRDQTPRVSSKLESKSLLRNLANFFKSLFDSFVIEFWLYEAVTKLVELNRRGRVKAELAMLIETELRYEDGY